LFKNKGIELKLDDPGRALSAADVLTFYTNTYPLLVTAKIVGPQFVDDTEQYRFESIMGTKG
jgi:PRTRC genetic system protein C